MVMAAPVYYTADMVRALPDDGNRYETVRGELLVTPAPRAWHQEIVARILGMLRAYIDRQSFGHVLMAPADISWSDDTLVQPDVFVVDRDEAFTMDWAQMKTLSLVVEVLSPGTARHDRFTKRRLYQDVRIPAYWILDPDARLVEMWSPDDELPLVERERISWSPPGAAEPFVLELDQLFRHPKLQ